MAAGHPSPGTILIGSESPAEDSRSTPFVVGVAGHRDLSAEGLAGIRAAARDFLLQLRAHLPDTELRVMSGLASGSDLLVAQVALDLEIAVDAVLPMPLKQYAEDFDAQSLSALEALIQHPKVRCTELLPPARAHGHADGDGLTERDALYFNLAQQLLRTCNLLIAVWDGKSPALPGGTSDTVLRFLEVHADGGAQREGWLFADAPAEEDPPLRLVFWIPAARIGQSAGDLGPPCFLSGLGENVLQRWRSMPLQLREQLGQLNTYNREYQNLLHSGQWSAPDSLISTLSPSVEVPRRIRPTLERIDAQYGKADGLAMYFQRRSDRLFTFFSVTAFAMGCAYLAYEKFVEVRALLLVYLFILLSGFGLYYILHGRRWFAKHLMCRALAETLRAKFYLCLGGADHLVDAEEVVSLSGIDRFHGFGWIVHVMTSFETPAALQGADQVPPGGSSAAVEMGWIESQRQYFISKVARLERSSRRTTRLKRALFVVILLVVLSLLLLGESAHRIQIAGVPLKNVLTFAMGLPAVMLGVWELHQNNMATRELLWQYRNQLNHFSRARTQLARITSESRRRQILAALGKDSLMESYLWTIHRYHREHEPPGRG